MKRSGKTYFITGGASGLGEACVRRLCSEGANVAIADRDAGTTTFFFFSFQFSRRFSVFVHSTNTKLSRVFLFSVFAAFFFFSFRDVFIVCSLEDYKVLATFLLFVLSRITKLSRRYFVCSLGDDEDFDVLSTFYLTFIHSILQIEDRNWSRSSDLELCSWRSMPQTRRA